MLEPLLGLFYRTKAPATTTAGAMPNAKGKSREGRHMSTVIDKFTAGFERCFEGLDGEYQFKFKDEQYGKTTRLSLVASGTGVRVALRIDLTHLGANQAFFALKLQRRNPLGGLQTHRRITRCQQYNELGEVVDWVFGCVQPEAVKFVEEYAYSAYSVEFKEFGDSIGYHIANAVSAAFTRSVLQDIYVAGPVFIDGYLVRGVVEKKYTPYDPGCGVVYTSECVGAADNVMLCCIGSALDRKRSVDVAFVTDGEIYCHMTHPSKANSNRLILLNDGLELTTVDRDLIHAAIQIHLDSGVGGEVLA